MWFIELPNGTEYELSVANGIALRGVQGNGMPPVNIIGSEYGLADGALYQRTKTMPRVITFLIDAVGSSWTNLHAVRAALIEASNPHRGVLPVRLWYRADSASGHGLYLDAYYEAGLEGGKVDGFVEESIAFRFLALDPFWKYETPTTAALGVRGVIAAEAYNILSLDRDTGVWSALIDTVANPDVYLDGTVSSVMYFPNDIAPMIFAGGAFTWYALVYTPETGRWMPAFDPPNGAVHAMVYTPALDFLIGGAFTTLYGSPYARIAIIKYPNPVSLGTGLDDTCYALWTPDGTKVFAGGAFANAGGSAAAKIAYWNGSAWAAIGSGMNGNVYAIKGRSVQLRSSVAAFADMEVYFGGAFTTAAGVTVNRVAKLNAAGDSFIALGSGMNGTVYAIEIAPNGNVYAGGAFTTAGGVTVNRVARWNGSQWSAMGSGFADGEVHALWRDPDNGTLYAGGTFTETTEGKAIPGGVAKYVPGSGVWLDASEGKLTAGGHDIKAITGASDRLIIAGAIDGEWVSSAKTTITNAGTARAYPTITITGPGRLYFLKNNTTGQSLYFDYELMPNEVVTLDFSPGVKTITSSWRGNILYAITGGSMVNWYLAPGANDVTCWVDHASATATYSFTPTYWSNDGAVPES